MLNQRQIDRLVTKVDELSYIYKKFLYEPLLNLPAEIFETAEFLSSPPANAAYRRIDPGNLWGGEYLCGWFRVSFKVNEAFAGKNLAVFADTGAVEHLIFLNNKPVGASDYVRETDERYRLHKYFRITDNAEAGSEYILYLEGYASHTIPNCHPLSERTTFQTQSLKPVREFQGISVGSINEEIRKFLNNLFFLKSLLASAKKPFDKAFIESIYVEIFKTAYRSPGDCKNSSVFQSAVIKCNKHFESAFLTSLKKDKFPLISIVGHSHMDTAWLWDIDETKRKLARTVVYALNLMDKFPDYTFIQSSPLHQEWLKESYPLLFEKIKFYESKGRFECNGGSFIECDANLTGGEAMIRQFVFGQKFMKDNFSHHADTYWLPDTFGYSGAVPQILKGCNIKYFMTTKLSCNDTNRFPYDTFYWRGIDGTKVLAQLNIISCYAEPQTVMERLDYIEDKHTSASTLISYGYGDGGGGPNEDMLKIADLTINNKYMPNIVHSTVSRHMQGVEKTAQNLPVFDGELYLETHRGTLTSKSLIKKYNRELENTVRELEILGSFCGADLKEDIDKVYKELLLNQFHDILPGSSIKTVNDNAVSRYEKAFKASESIRRKLGCANDYLFNTLCWDIDVNLETESSDGNSYKALDGKRKKLLFNIKIPAFSSIKTVSGQNCNTLFCYDGNTLSTPYFIVKFDKAKRIVSLFDLSAKRELVESGGCLNAFWTAEDMPLITDAWDIDADFEFKAVLENRLAESKVICDSGHFRLRNTYQIAESSTLSQDIVFYPNSKRIDFETKLNWKDFHRLLKTAFDIDIKADFIRSEIQFGHIQRSLKNNTAVEQAMYEVCNHKWSDISESRYGVALLNDCKYGIGAKNKHITLTLLKSGTHPDESGDTGEHFFKYALLPHEGGFSVENVIRPAYEFNIAPCRSPANCKGFVKVSNSNVIIETVKLAEDGLGRVVRLYECEGTKTNLELSFNRKYKITVTNMLEEQLYPAKNADIFKCTLRPFEILTIKVEG